MLFTSTHEPCEEPGQLAEALGVAQIVEPKRIQDFLREYMSRHPQGDVNGFGNSLVQQGVLSRYQYERALVGEVQELLLGPYLVLESLGGGSLGSMFLAQSRNDRKRYALKVLPMRSLWKVMKAKSLLATFASLPAHPTIIPFRDIDSAQNRHYLAWPFVEGETLHTVVCRNGVLPHQEATRIFAEIAEGLAICHSAGIVHGMLKPSNILLDREKRPKILDLAVGTLVLENLDDDQSLLDTISTAHSALDLLDFAAPETIEDPNARNTATDIYSLGCVFYFALTGVAPFPDGNVVDRMIAHQTQTPMPVQERNPQIPQALADIVAQCLHKSPDDRPADLWTLRDQLQLFLFDPSSSQSGDSGSNSSVFGTVHLSESPSGSNGDRSGALSFWNAPASQFDDDGHGSIDFNEIPEPEWTPPAPTAPKRNAPPPILTPPTANSPDDDVPVLGLPVISETPESPSLSVRQVRLLGDPRAVKLDAEVPKKELPKQVSFDLPPTPLKWSESGQSSSSPVSMERPIVEVPPLPTFGNALTRSAGWLLRYIRSEPDIVQISVYGPPKVIPGEHFDLMVYTHPPTAFRSVGTLCRAMRKDWELLGSGYVDQPVKRGSNLSLYLWLASAGVAKSRVKFSWIGQTHPRTFRGFIPWESPIGLTSGMVNLGLDEQPAGTVEFHYINLPRKS